MDNLRVTVTGDRGTDIFTRYLPGCLPGNDRDFYPRIAYDVQVPTGASQHYAFLKWLHRHALCPKPYFRPPREHTLPQSLHFLDSFKDATNTKVLRERRRAPLRLPDNLTQVDALTLPTDDSPADFLAIHDATHTWRHSNEAKRLVDQFLGSRPDTRRLQQAGPAVIVVLGESLSSFNPNENPVWSSLRSYSTCTNSAGVAIICSAASLRRAGSAISRRLSWEQTIEDTLTDLRYFELLKGFGGFKHLFIRFGFAAILYIRSSPSSAPRAEFIFAPNARDGIFRDEADHGKVFARNSAILGCLLQAGQNCYRQRESLDTAAIVKSLKTAMTLGMRWFEAGLPCPAGMLKKACIDLDHSGSKRRPNREKIGRQFLEHFFSAHGKPGTATLGIVKTGYDSQLRNRSWEIARECILSGISIPSKCLASNVPGGQKSKSRVGSRAESRRQQTAHIVQPASNVWQILRLQVNRRNVCRINLGIAICKFGHQHVLNRPLDYPDNAAATCGVSSADVREILSRPRCSTSKDLVPDDQPQPKNSHPINPYKTKSILSQPTLPDSVYVPVLEYGDLVAIERDECESLRSIRNLFKAYLDPTTQSPISTKPISIAVFGAPGSGKSFAVKQIAKSFDRDHPSERQLEIIECNVAQFRTVEDLGHAITRIASINNQHRIPLVFFDEFDCEFDNAPLGWLKYFLAPMQDGTFYGARQTITFGRAIFVFCGGIYSSLADFYPFDEPSLSNESDRQKKANARPHTGTVRRSVAAKSVSGTGDNVQLTRRKFREQKGPDFVSRLRGHIDILSINPDQTAPKDENRKPLKPILRRALTLRGQLRAAGLLTDRNGHEVANVDEDVLYALLTIDHYRHGARSMEAILQMCNPIDGILEKASLPSRAQLNMHVSADDFMIYMQRGRFRRTSHLPVSAPSELVENDAPVEKRRIERGLKGSPSVASKTISDRVKR